MISCGIAVTFLLPSAFVTLPAPRLEKLPPRDRLQIVSAGCFHNFVFLCWLFSISWSGAGSLPTRIFFQDSSSRGRLITSVVHVSVSAFLQVNALISFRTLHWPHTSLLAPWSLGWMISRWLLCHRTILGIATYFYLPQALCKVGAPIILF